MGVVQCLLRNINGEVKFLPCFSCHGLLSQAILEDTEGELERKFKILGSEYGADWDVSRLPLEVPLLRDFLSATSKVERDMILMTK